MQENDYTMEVDNWVIVNYAGMEKSRVECQR